MRKIALGLLVLIIGYCCHAQIATKDRVLKEKVRVTNWKKKIFAFQADYWEDEKAAEVIRQVGAEEFRKIKTFSKAPTTPGEMSILSNNGMGIKDTAILYNSMNRLNIYKIATYIQTNKAGRSVEMAILSVPYDENMDWNKDVKWDNLYFFIRSEFLEPAN